MTRPAAVELELVPVRGRPSYFSAVLPDGRVLIRASRQPVLDGARALAAEGLARESVITARHRGNTIVAMRSTVGEAAKWTIEESDRGGLRRRLWKPFGIAGSFRDGVPEKARGHVEVGIPSGHPLLPLSLTDTWPGAVSRSFPRRSQGW